MKGKSIKKITVLCAAGALALTINMGQVHASPYVSDQGVAGISKVMNEYLDKVDTDITIDITSEYSNLGIANVSDYLNVRKGPGEDQEKIGQLTKDGGCDIIEVDENGWAKIKSGKIEGYVDSTYLLTDEEAMARAGEVASLTATVRDAGSLRVRESANLLAATITLLSDGDKIEVVEIDEIVPEWIRVKTDLAEGYVSSDYVDVTYELKDAVSIEALQSGTTSAGVRTQIVSFAKQYLGGSYVWGGTTLGSGVDCSGFTQAIYSNFGYSIPRVSGSQANAGRRISAAEAKPGDLFFYGSGGTVNHVGMYIGNGQIIHASSPSTGIIISNAYYDSPISVNRYIND